MEDPTALVEHALANFKAKYFFFVSEVARMEPLFEASFTLAEAAKGTPFTRCGLTDRLLHLIPSRPPRLYNPVTEDVWLLPVGGAYRCHPQQGRRCPVCRFELLLYILPDNRTFPLCVACFNRPQPDEWGYQPPPPLRGSFAGGSGGSGGGRGTGNGRGTQSSQQMGLGFNFGCLECPLGDRHPIIHELAVCGDASASGGGGGRGMGGGGVFLAEPSAPGLGPAGSSQGRRLISTRSSVTVDLPRAVKKLRVLSDDETARWLAKRGRGSNGANGDSVDAFEKEGLNGEGFHCDGDGDGDEDDEDGYSRLLEVIFEEELTPLDGGRTRHVGSVMRDELLQSLLQVKHMAPLDYASIRGGKGKGKGERRPRRVRDPKMSFRDF